MAPSSALVKSHPLDPSGQIGIISVSSSISPDRLKAGVDYLRSLGFKVKIPIDPSKNYGRKDFLFSAAGIAERVEALHELFCDPEISAILAARGAYGSMEILDSLDYALIKANPKLVIGLSDTTALLIALYQKAKLVTIHGPTLQSAFAKATTSALARRSAEALLSYLHGEQRNPFLNCELKAVRADKPITAKLIGGNLSLLSALMGTPYEPRFDNHILFLEEVGEKPFRIHRMLLQMKLAGKFDHLQGLLLGDFSRCDVSTSSGAGYDGPTVSEVLNDIFSSFSFPILSQLPVGHEDLCLPMPIGVRAKISQNKLEIIEAAVL